MPLQRNQALALGDGLVQLLFGIVVAQGVGPQCGIDIGGFDQRATACAAQGRAFDHQGVGVGKQRTLATLVVGFAVGLLQQACHGAGGKVGQAAFFAAVGDKDGSGVARGGAGRKTLGKVHLHAKPARGVGVGLLQGVVLLNRADQHDLHVHIHGFGLQRDGCGGAVGCRAAFVDLQAAAAQKAAQPWPQALVVDEVAQVQHDEAAMGLEQAARADARKIGVRRIGVGLQVDGAKQTAQLRVVFHDHGCAVAFAVVHRQVHLAAGQQVGQALLALVFGIGVISGSIACFEQCQVRQHFALDLVEPLAQLGAILDLFFETLADVLHRMFDQWLDGLAAQIHQGLIAGALQRAHGVQKARNLGAQGLLGGIDFGAAFARQGQGLVFRERVAFVAREGEHHLAAFAREAKVAGLCKGIQRGKGAGLLGLPGFLYGLGFGFAIGAGQALGDVGLQHLGHLQHGCAQLAPLPGGQAQGAGALGGVKVVQIAQVRRHGTLGRSGLCGLAQQRGAPAAHFAQNEQVVVGLVHGQAKLGGGLGALLADPGQGQVL